MKIEIFGKGCPKCKQTFKNVQEAVKEVGIEAEICEMKDVTKIADYGVMITPAVVVDGEVKSAGKIPNTEEIKKWISL